MPVPARASASLSLQDGYTSSGLTPDAFWLLYVGVGGSMTASGLLELVHRDDDPATALSPYDHNLIAQALNEYFSDHGQDHPVAYREQPAAD